VFFIVLLLYFIVCSAVLWRTKGRNPLGELVEN